ncbi:hypothetical protein SO802_020204 [Lithocarpus litseifolius]|uniref:Uncharacterized protein n=1 Tax=Lithocarpus litseifolius TaxID=425828 RepID=A0AAW2CCW8_9ROSI
MDSQERTQQPHNVLANKLFLLRHPQVQDIEKVYLKDEVFSAVKSDAKLLTADSPSERHGSLVRNPSYRFNVRERSGAFGLDPCQDQRRNQKARR